MVGDGREWLAGQPLPDTAREQIMVALAMIDALDVQIAPIDGELRAYARAQTGCKALIDAYYGIGELTAVTVIAELGDCRRFANSRDAVRYSGLDTVPSNCTSCSENLGLVADMGGVPGPFAAGLFDVGAERDPQAAAVSVRGELAVPDPVVDHVG